MGVRNDNPDKDHTYLYAAIFFLAMALIIFFRNNAYYSIYNSLWFCDFSLILFSVAFFMENVQFIKGLINIGLIAQFIYILDVIMYIIFGITWSNIPAEMLSSGLPNIIFSLAIHLFSANLALYITYSRKTKPFSLLYSAMVLLLLYFLTVFMTPPSNNVNFIFSSEFLFGLDIPFYIYLWPLLAFMVLSLPTYRFQSWLYRHARKNIDKAQ